MRNKYIANSFSINMVAVNYMSFIRVKEIKKRNMPRKNFISAIGHEDTARVVSSVLGYDVPCNRISLRLEANDVLYVAQYVGPRLPEGATKLPEGAEIKFYEVTIDTGCGDCRSEDCFRCSMISWMQGY